MNASGSLAPILAISLSISTAIAAASTNTDAGMDMPMGMPMPPPSKATAAHKRNEPSSHPANTKSPESNPSHTHPETHPASNGKPSTMPHVTSSMPAAHAMSDMAMGNDSGSMPAHRDASTAPMQVAPPIPPATAAAIDAAFPALAMPPMHGHDVNSLVLFDRIETVARSHGNDLRWEGTAWIGTDLDRFWLRSEGEVRNGHGEHVDLEVLYGHSVSTWWDIVAGWRHDLRPGAAQDFAALGVIGTLPYKIGLSATAYLGRGRQTAARFEGEYELPLSGRWYLQPRMELNLYGRDDPRRGIGAGLSSMEAGLRLRYEITRQFAPYLGIEHEHRFGSTADMGRATGERPGDTRIVIGLRAWF